MLLGSEPDNVAHVHWSIYFACTQASLCFRDNGEAKEVV